MKRNTNITIDLAVCNDTYRRGFLHLYLNAKRQIILRFCIHSELVDICHYWYYKNVDAAKSHFATLNRQYFQKDLLQPLPKFPKLAFESDPW